MAISSKSRKNAGTARPSERNGTTAARTRRCPDFLTFHFDDKPAPEIYTIAEMCGGIDIQSLENSARSFLRTYGKELEYESTGNVAADLVRLNKTLKESIEGVDGVELINTRLEDGSHRQEFVVYKIHRGVYTMQLWIIPIQLLEYVKEELKDILLDFFAFLERHSPFLLPKASYDINYSLGIFDADFEESEPDEEQASEWSDEYRAQVNRYLKGDINDYFNEIQKRSSLDINGQPSKLVPIIKKKIREFRLHGSKTYQVQKDGDERLVSKLLEAIEDGIKINLEDTLFNHELRNLRYIFGDDDFLDEEEFGNSSDIIDFGRQFMFTWGMYDDDEVVEATIDILNADAGNILQTTLLSYIRISACAKKVKFGDFPERWEKWYIQFLNCIE